MVALLRGHPEAASAVGLVVLDEAHILLKETRADAAEMALRSIVDVVPDASGSSDDGVCRGTGAASTSA